MSYKIVLFDDHPIIVQALQQYFENIDQIEVVGSFNDTNDLLEFIKYSVIDFLIADIITEQEMGLQLFEIIAKKYPSIKVITYSSVTSDIVLDELKKYGVIASIHKKRNPDAIFDIIMQYSVKQSDKTIGLKSYSLSPKEKEIAQYLVKGLASKEIASMTNSAVNTINNQKNKLLTR